MEVGKQLQNLYKVADSIRERSSYIWSDCRNFFGPYRRDVYSTGLEEGVNSYRGIHPYLVTSDPIMVCDKFVSGMSAYLTNPELEFFKLILPGLLNDTEDKDEIDNYLRKATSMMHSILKMSNFGINNEEHWYELGVYGSHLTEIVSDENTVIKFRSHQTNSYSIFK